MKKCPACNDSLLEPAYTRQGADVDTCPSCKGVWFDRDTIYYFSDTPILLKQKIKDAFEKKNISQRKSPISGQNMVDLSMFDGDVHINFCIQSGGIWVERQEMPHFPKEIFKMDFDKGTLVDPEPMERVSSYPPVPLRLPNLTSGLLSVYAGVGFLLVVLVVVVMLYTDLPAVYVIVSAFFLFVLQYTLSPFLAGAIFKILYPIKWIQPMELPNHLEEFISEVCRQNNIKFPKIGILRDSTPQIFTYGHFSGNARIVMSEGLKSSLDSHELEAVVAHELGHITERTISIMTSTQVLPLIFFCIYRRLIKVKLVQRDRKVHVGELFAPIIFCCYLASQFPVLWFSRLREYHADRFSAIMTGKPEKLCSALVKIASGLAGQKANKLKSDTSHSAVLFGLEPFGIFNATQADGFVISGAANFQKLNDEVSREMLKNACKWDMWNPWAGYFEFYSTHPLIAKRVHMLNELGVSMGKEAYVDIDRHRPDSYWQDFSLQLFICMLPNIIVFSGLFIFAVQAISYIRYVSWLSINLFPIGLFFMFVGISYLIKVIYSYPARFFLPLNIKALIRKDRVSPVTPVACRVSGKSIGQGIVGSLYSDDYILADETGIIFLDYQQPLGIMNLLFNLLRKPDFHNQDVEILGWYRRGPVPYIEVQKIKVNDKIYSCHTKFYKIALALIFIAAGLAIIFYHLYNHAFLAH